MHTPTKSAIAERRIIAVDLDGTLILTDILHESILQLLRLKPLAVFAFPVWLLGGKAAFKAKLADHVVIKSQSLPYHQPLMTWLGQQYTEGSKLVLCSGTDQRVARSIADHLGIFDDVLGSDGLTNNTGQNKRAALDKRYGQQMYDYVGNSPVDIPIWAGARKAIVVNAGKKVVEQAGKVSQVDKVFPVSSISLKVWSRVFRVHQWLKNLLLFVPLLAAHQLGNIHGLAMLAVAFLSFSVCASAVYITNDLIDLESDRQHPRKRTRPFASGSLPLHYGVLLVPLLLALSVGLAIVVGSVFTSWLLAYGVLTTAYSLWLKRYPIIDCLTLAGLYTLRILAGAAAVMIAPSFWLLAFSVFMFLSLAYVKRYGELQLQGSHNKMEVPGRGYVLSDASLVQAFGIAAGYAGVLVLALYMQGETVVALYKTPSFIWGTLPLMLFWVNWLWMKAHRGQMHDDPLIFTLRDKASLVVAFLVTMCFVLATIVGS